MHLLYNYIQTLRTYGYLVATPLYLPINMPYLTCKDKVDTVFILCLYVQVDIFHNKLQSKIGQSKFNFFLQIYLPTYLFFFLQNVGLTTLDFTMSSYSVRKI